MAAAAASLPPAQASHQRSRPTPALRLAAAGVAALACLLVILGSTGILTGRLVGAADNGDGIRLYCGAGIVPDTASHRSNWVGGPVVEFTRGEGCPDPIPSSALIILKAAAYGHTSGWSLTSLVWVYALLAAAVTAVAVWAATPRRLAGALVVAPPLLPLVNSDYTRFFLSTFSEPAGLLGTYLLLAGVAVLGVTRPSDRVERILGLALTAGGGLLAATAKVGYLPLLLVAVAVCAVTTVRVGSSGRDRRWPDRAPGVVAAALTVVLAVAPLQAALSWQDRGYPSVNAHNIIFTMLIPEVGPGAATAVGLPPEAAARAGFGFYDSEGASLDPNSIPGWQTTIGDDPDGARAAAYRTLLHRPDALARAVGVAMQATRGADLDYILADPVPAGISVPVQVVNSASMGTDTAWLHRWLDRMPAPWWSSLLAALGILAGAAGLRARRWGMPALTRTAAVAAAAAVGIAVTAVLGDGYYEIAKHVWLAAYLLDVTLYALAGATVVVAASGVRRAVRRAPVHTEASPVTATVT
ncbi:glycan biosynthesis hexose transferase WsfD [Blastococcus mobilis]|uniref:Uncharacterized protein n=1 Tax=Blastococcus mobilis TaxID=1938746 RepID=A0A238XG33_9ACTN|nr:hypothetical protein [Blastococcus mobilis]SNR57965.1 hypothetical protein SAMN06272737_113111 [Blastococcus mobilis]